MSLLVLPMAALAQDIPRAPQDGGPRRWVVTAGPLAARITAEAAAPETVRHDTGAILANLGCAVAQGRIWCRVRDFRGGPAGHVPTSALTAQRDALGDIISGPNDSRARARAGDFDARGKIACAQEAGQALGSCSAEVARSDGGDATLVATFGNGFARHLFFVNGEFVAASATMSGAGRDAAWRLQDGLFHLRVDDQRYEIPRALVLGQGPQDGGAGQ